MADDTVLYSRSDDNIVTVTLNRPKVHNAFNAEVISRLKDIFRELQSDNTARLVVLQGEGKSFCAGADLNWMSAVKDYTYEENCDDAKEMADMFNYINSCPIPTIAKVQGFALGGATGLLSVCDFVLAAEDAKIGFTEVKLGLIPAVISPFVTAKIGESAARAYFFSGEVFSADEARHINLVHRIAPKQELDNVLEKVVQTFLQAGPQAVRRMKKFLPTVIKESVDGDYQKVGEITSKETAEVRADDEGQAGMLSLLEKRKAPWIK